MTKTTDSDRLPLSVRVTLPERPESVPEPVSLDPATIDALARFTGSVERLVRASRPIVLTGPAPAPAPYAKPGPDPINVRIPSAPADRIEPQPEPLPRLFVRAEVSYFMGATAMITGGVSCALDLVGRFGGFPFVVMGGLWVLISAAAINRWAKRYGGIEVIHGRVKPRPGSDYR